MMSERVAVLADTLCPECHGPFELRAVRRASLLKRCVECGHRWLEEREVEPDPFIRRGGYVWRRDGAP